LDNFHAGHSSVDDRTGHNLWAWCDASAAGVGHNFDRDELCLPKNIVELMKNQSAGTLCIHLGCGMELHCMPTDEQFLLLNQKDKEVYEEVCSVFICGEPGDI
jgi:hypothetical protein